MRLAAAALLLIVALPASAGPKGKGTHTPPPPNPYVVPDANDPRVLHPAPGFFERGFDRGWVERTSMPRLPASVFDDIERVHGNHPVRLLHPTTTPSPYAATSLSGNITVIEGDNNLVINTGNGIGFNHNDGMITVVNDVIGRLGDNFDFITVFTTFTDSNPNVAAYYFPLRQDIEGLGECNFQTGETFGCIFDQTGGLQLQGVVFMNSLASWRQWDSIFDGSVHAFDSFDSAVFSTLGQEVAHRWGSGLRFVDPRNGNVSKKLLGRDNSHWAAWVDTDASVMDGWDWAAPDKNGRYDLLNDMDVYSTLDLYAMGAVPVASAKPFFFIDSAKYSEQDSGSFGLGMNGRAIGGSDVLASGLPSVGLMNANGIDMGATGQEVDLTIQDIVDAEGNRCPDPDHAQRTFRQAIVLVTRTGETAAQAQGDVDDLEVVAQTWESWWLDRTGHALTLCTSATADCLQATAELGGGAVVPESGDFVERGTTPKLQITVTAGPDTDVKNASVHIELTGDGANNAGIQVGAKHSIAADFAVGDVPKGTTQTVNVPVTFDNDYACAFSTIAVATLHSDNAPSVTEQYRLFPGYSTIFEESFGAADHFKVNLDGKDGATTGAFEREDVALSCDITPRTPERDASPENAGAYVTGAADELKGDTSLWSPPVSLKGTVAPELHYDFWLDGEDGDKLLVQLSDDGGRTFKLAVKKSDSFHGWRLGTVPLKSVFGTIPDRVNVRFVFEGNGHLEGGIDGVTLLDPQGQCRALAQGFCGCTAEGGAGPQASLTALAGLLALRLLRRRPRA